MIDPILDALVAPVSAATQSHCVLAPRGAGKTTAALTVAEARWARGEKGYLVGPTGNYPTLVRERLTVLPAARVISARECHWGLAADFLVFDETGTWRRKDYQRATAVSAKRDSCPTAIFTSRNEDPGHWTEELWGALAGLDEWRVCSIGGPPAWVQGTAWASMLSEQHYGRLVLNRA